MNVQTCIDDIRFRLGESSANADFWSAADVLRALNEAHRRFAVQERWPWLYTRSTPEVLSAGARELVLVPGVSVEREFNLTVTFSGDPRPRTPRRVLPAEGQKLEAMYYTSASDIEAYYLYTSVDDGSDEVQELENAGSTSGNFTLTFDGQATGNLSRGSTRTQIEAALKALSNIGPGDVTCSGGPLGTAPVVIRFRGALAESDVPELVLGGTTTNMTITTTQAGAEGSGRFLTTVRFVPELTRDATLVYTYLRVPAELSSADDVLDVPETYAAAVVAYATGSLWLKELLDSQKASEQFALFQSIVDDAKRDTRKFQQGQGFAWGRNQPEHFAPTDDDWSRRVIGGGPLGP